MNRPFRPVIKKDIFYYMAQDILVWPLATFFEFFFTFKQSLMNIWKFRLLWILETFAFFPFLNLHKKMPANKI